MNKILGILLFLIAMAQVGNSQAESYKAFEWDIIRFGYVIPSGNGVTSGISLGTEPRFNITDNISAGLRIELALVGTDVEGGSAGAAGSYVAVGDYYFSNSSSKRAFAGLGIGSYSGASITVGNTKVDGGSGLGISPRVGYELGHLRLSAEYNLPFKDGVPKYLSVNLGITLFGGYTR